MGLSYAATVVIGTEIGANRPVNAIKYARLIRIFAYIIGALVSTLLFFGAHGISSLYTKIENV